MVKNKGAPGEVEIIASAIKDGRLETWLDGLKTGGLIATIPITATGGETNREAFRKALKTISGHHDVFIKFPAGNNRQLFISSIRFIKAKGS